MSRKGISKLSLPERQYDPAYSTEREDGEIKLETLAQAQAEDRFRIASTSKNAHQRFSFRDCGFIEGHRERVDPLSGRLIQAIDGVPFTTPASQVHMRGARRAIAGGLWKLSVEHDFDERFFVLMPRCWEIPSEELLSFDPKRIIRPFRAMLQHYGSSRADGYLFAGIDGEFYEPEKVFRLHLQGIAAAGMVDVVKRLRRTRKFKPTGGTSSGRKRTVLRMEKVHSRPDPYTYAIKSSWFVKSFFCPDQGKEIRLKKPRRIPDPHHARYLQWLDQWRVEDLTVLVGLRVRSDGLEYRPAKSNRFSK